MASGQRCEYSSRDLSSVVNAHGRTAAIGDAQQTRRLRRRHDDRSVGRPRRAARIAADVRDVDHRPAADRDLGQLALAEERQPPSVRREERLPGAVRASETAQRRIAQLAQVEPPRPALGRVDGEQ
jgi:adenine-specific DNA methylase